MGLLRMLFRALTRGEPNSRKATTRHYRTKSVNVGRESWQVHLPNIPKTGVITGKCYVIDGDTVIIKRTKIRLSGIDAPELDQPWGQKSKWAMVGICKGHVITAKLNGERSHDRLVATCYDADGRDIGAEIIKQGLALDWRKFSGGKYRHLEPQGVRNKLRQAHHN